MQSSIAQGSDGAPGVTRRVVRLLVLLGAMVAAYLVLSLFDHGARADTGSIDHPGATDPVASVKIVAAGTRQAVPVPKAVAATAAHQQSIRRPAIKMAEVRPTKVSAPKIPAKAKTPVPYVRAGQTVRQVQIRTSKLRQSTSAAVQNIARVTGSPARKVVVRPKLSATSWPQLPGPPQAELAAWPQLSAWPQPPGRPQAPQPVLAQTRSPVGAPARHQPLMPPVSAQLYPLPRTSAFAAASGLSAVTKPPTAPAQPLTAPRPVTPRPPTDFSTTTGQARDSGGGGAPAIGTVASSWRPEVTAAGRRLATDVIAGGRTIRYAGPPS